MDCGVYQVLCFPNGKSYVGSSVRIKTRWSQHKTDLRAGRHHSVHFQRCWDKYGHEAFTWSILELCSEEELFEVEQQYLDDTQPKLNGSSDASAPMRGRKLSEEHKAKISATLRRQRSGRPGNRLGSKMPLEARAKISKAMVGNTYRKGKKASAAEIEKNRAAHLGRKVSQSTREKLRKVNIGKKLSEETKAKIGAKQRAHQTKHGNPMKGRKRPDLVKRNRERANGTKQKD